MSEVQPLVNKTIRAIVVLFFLLYSTATIGILIKWGDPHNSLHSSAMAWSYSLIIFNLIALGIDSAAVTIVSTMVGRTTVVNAKKESNI